MFCQVFLAEHDKFVYTDVRRIINLERQDMAWFIQGLIWKM